MTFMVLIVFTLLFIYFREIKLLFNLPLEGKVKQIPTRLTTLTTTQEKRGSTKMLQAGGLSQRKEQKTLLDKNTKH